MLEVPAWSPLVLQPPFSGQAGLRWSATLPRQAMWPSDSMDCPVESRLLLCEDGTPLGPAHALHADIETVGRGRYSHWNGALLFSTSDETDPNANGRTYTIEIGAPTLRMRAFGSCHVHAAVRALEQRGLAYSAWRQPVISFSPRETLQLIRFDLAHLHIPPALLPFAVECDSPLKTSSIATSPTDVVILEFGQTIDIEYDSLWLMRRVVRARLLGPLRSLGPSECRIANRWYQHGIILRNENLRRETAEQLIAMLPRIDIDPELGRDIITRARGALQSPQQIAATLRQIGEIFGAAPIFILASPNAFMPDGRPVIWPIDFVKHLEAVCGELGLPLIRLGEMVMQRGTEFSLQADLHHLTEPFLDHLGEQFLALSHQALERA
jgi:hypothetical protein